MNVFNLILGLAIAGVGCAIMLTAAAAAYHYQEKMGKVVGAILGILQTLAGLAIIVCGLRIL